MDNNGKGTDLKYDEDYNETIGFFSDSFYRKKELNKEFTDDVNINEGHIESIGEEKLEETPEPPVSQIENKDLMEEVKNADGLKSDSEGTYNAFINKKGSVPKDVENPLTESVKKEQPIKEVHPDNNGEKVLKSNSSKNNSDGIKYSFFTAERIRIANENAKEKKTYKILSIVCVALFFIVIPLFLLPVFVYKYFKCNKKGIFSTFLNYNTLKWKEIKGATVYEVYIMVDKSDVFQLLSIEYQPKCSLPRGTNKYLVIAKNNSAIIAVSEIIPVSV